MSPPESEPRQDDGIEPEHHVRLPSLPQRLGIIERIMTESIRERHVRQYRARAQFTFLAGADPTTVAGYDSQLEVMGRCLEWFVFDYVIPELETTPARHWFETHAEALTAAERQDARDCLKFLLGLFEVSHLDQPEGFDAVDLLRPPLRHHVREHLLTRELQDGQLLLGRLFPHRGHFVLSGMSVVMAEGAAAQIRELIASGRLRPAALVENLDGVELENCLESGLRSVAHLEPQELEPRVRRYLTEVVPGRLGWDEFEVLLAESPDPVAAAAAFADRMEICCRHEMDLLFDSVMRLWQRHHQVD